MEEREGISPGTACLIPLKWRQSQEQPHQNDVCYRAEDEPEVLDLEEQRGEESLQLAHLLPGPEWPVAS